MTEIVAPFQQFFDTSGAPLANGAIYIGAANLDAESNPIAVFWDEALTIPAAQPIRTLNGYPARNGAPARLYANVDSYSMTVRNAQGRIVYSVVDVTNATLLSDFQAQLAAPSGANLVGFLQSGAGAILRTAQEKMRDIVNVKDFGAKGDNVTDDLAAIQAACSEIQSRGGGAVYIPPTGLPYRITGTIALGNGVVLTGDPCKNFPGVTATPQQWAAAGSWLRPEHPTAPAVRCQGHGSGVSGINFVHNQPVPSGTFTPTQYGYCISQNISFSTLSDIVIVNAWNGIEAAYTSVSGGGTNVLWQNILISAFNVRFRTSNVNDVMRINALDCRNMYYASTPSVVNYIRANTIGWQCGYTDNIQISGIQFFEESKAIYLENETCLGITHSLYNAQLANVQFSLCQKSVVLANSSVNSRAFFSNCLAQQGNAFGYTWADQMFDLSSNDIYWVFDGLRVVEAGGQIMTIGNGSGGKVLISNLEVENFSTVASGQSGFVINTGAELRLTGYRINKTPGAGFRFSGSGLDNLRTDQYSSDRVFSVFGQVDITGLTGYTSWSTENAMRFGSGRIHLVQLAGEIEVFAAAASSTFSVRMSGLPDLEVAGLDGGTVGFRSFNTGWIEVPESLIASFSTLGRFQVNPTNAALRLRNGSVTVLFK